MYQQAAKVLSSKIINWRELALIDSALVEKFVNNGDIRGHAIDVDYQTTESDVAAVQDFLHGEYQRFLKVCELKIVPYLPTLNCSPLGVFSKKVFKKDEVITGLTGYLSEMKSAEVTKDKNDFSLIASKLLGKQWLMLGPIAFVNHSCVPNAKFFREKCVMTLVTLRAINPCEEIVVLYDRHFFGAFNEDCCCEHKRLHKSPFPASPERRTRKRKICEVRSEEVKAESFQKFVLSNKEISSRFSVADQNLNESSDEDSELPVKQIQYNSIYLESTPPEINACDLSNSEHEIDGTQSLIEDLENKIIEVVSEEKTEIGSFVSESTSDFLTLSPPILESTPVEIFDHEICNENFDDSSFNESQSVDLYLGSEISVSDFRTNFDLISSRHKLSDSAKKDILKLVSLALPSPNNIHSLAPACLVPNIVTKNFDGASVLVVNLWQQLSNIIEKNLKLIKLSWSENCDWCASSDNFEKGQVQLVLNFDGASVFKSRSLAIWPLWVQLYNLPPKVRCAINNMSILALWQGVGKPDFSAYLPIIVSELQLLLKQKNQIEGLGKISFKIRCLVADMPATAYALCMTQHMGYFSCTFCFIRGVHHHNRLLFPVKSELKMRSADSFLSCARKTEEKKTAVLGIKAYSPFYELLSLPWGAPIDPMHQVFLGTAKVLCKMIIAAVPKNSFSSVQHRLNLCSVPFNILHRPKKT